MELDALLHTYFGTENLDTLEPAMLANGIERLRTAFGLERDPGRRFALWVLLHMLGEAPDPRDAFKDRATQDAALRFIGSAARTDEGA
ncbi:MAG: hypothetical protein CMN73_13130 [Sphingomonas sp.]|nr:hypothetical protein [Sphingomonas sp.]